MPLLPVNLEDLKTNMDTAANAPSDGRATNRVLEALSTLAALLDRTIKEVRSLEEDFQSRLSEAVRETEASAQSQTAQHLEEWLTATRAKLEDQFKSKIAQTSAEWEMERERLTVELAGRIQMAAQWEAERARLNTEIERLMRVQEATQLEAEQAVTALKLASASKQNSSADSQAVLEEVARVEQMIKEVSALIEDPSTELSTIIRKNVERAELQSYLRGIQFALRRGKTI
jgi:chromosome segregation ATPase